MSELEFDVDEDTALEIGYAIFGRANALHEDANPDNEEMAKRLRELGNDVIEEYE